MPAKHASILAESRGATSVATGRSFHRQASGVIATSAQSSPVLAFAGMLCPRMSRGWVSSAICWCGIASWEFSHGVCPATSAGLFRQTTEREPEQVIPRRALPRVGRDSQRAEQAWLVLPAEPAAIVALHPYQLVATQHRSCLPVVMAPIPVFACRLRRTEHRRRLLRVPPPCFCQDCCGWMTWSPAVVLVLLPCDVGEGVVFHHPRRKHRPLRLLGQPRLLP